MQGLSTLPDIAVISVATNRYLDYWKHLVLSADQFLQPGAQLIFYVFTDDTDQASQVTEHTLRSRVIPIPVPPMNWPDATLLRYELFAQVWSHISQEIVMHLDADMLVCAECRFTPEEIALPTGIAFVRHPGFRRASLGSTLKLYLQHPRYLFGDSRLWLRNGGLGTWESSRKSLAFVPRRNRDVYVCGGTWLGLREPLGQMVELLASRTRSDLDQGVVAAWHDESHLNWYASNFGYFLFDSDKCFARGYRNLGDLEPQIIAVDKGENRTR